MLRGSLRLIAPGLTVVALTAIAGCSNDDKPRTLPPVSETPSSASPTPTPSGLNAASAEAFVRHYYETLATAANTGDVRELEHVLAPSCPCHQVIGFIRNKYATGGRLEGAKYTFETVGPTHLDHNLAAVQIVYSFADVREVAADGKIQKTEPGVAHRAAVVSLAWKDRWYVTNDQDLK